MAEWEYLLWKIGWKDYCLPCDKIFRWPQRKQHKSCRCGGLWML